MENTKFYDLSDLQAAAPKVLEEIKSLASVPQYGTVAGQAVASIFQKVLGHSALGPINDIDVFVNKHLPRHLRGRPNFPLETGRQRKQKIAHREDDVYTQEATRYNHVKFIASRSTLNILSTYTNGIVNYTIISPNNFKGSWGHDASVSQALVEGFDLNMVGVGINLQTGEVVATDQYLEFLNTCQVKVKTCNTPMHTIIRLASKLNSGQFSGIHCDYAHERSKLEASIYCQNTIREAPNDKTHLHAHIGSTLVGSFGSGKYKKMYEQNAHMLPPVKQIKPDIESYEVDDGYRLNTLVVDRPTNPNVQPLIDRFLEGEFPRFLNNMLLCSDFPQLYDLFTQPSSNQRARQEGFLSLNNQDDEILSMQKYHKAIGKEFAVPNDEVPESLDTAVFFFNQRHACTQTLQKKALSSLALLSPAQQKVLHGMNFKADDIVSFVNNPDKELLSLFESRTRELVQAFYDSSYGDEVYQIESLARRVMDLSSISGLESVTQVAKQILGANPWDFSSSSGYRNPVLAQFMSIFPPSSRSQIAQDFIEGLAPAWPNISGLSKHVQCAILSTNSLALARPLKEDVLLQVDPEDRSFCVREMINWFKSDSPPRLDGYTPDKTSFLYPFLAPDLDLDGKYSGDDLPTNLRQFLSTAIPQVPNSGLAENQGELLIMMMNLLTPQQIYDELQSRPRDEIWSGMLEKAIKDLDDHPGQSQDFSTYTPLPARLWHVDRWFPLKDSSKTKILPVLKNLLLSNISSRPELTSPSPRPPRL